MTPMTMTPMTVGVFIFLHGLQFAVALLYIIVIIYNNEYLFSTQR